MEQEGVRGHRGRDARRASSAAARSRSTRKRAPSLSPASPTPPGKDAEKKPVKALVLKLLAEKYGIEEEDFLSAELEVVPAGRCPRLRSSTAP